MLHLYIRISMPCIMVDTLQQILIPIMALYYKYLIQSISKHVGAVTKQPLKSKKLLVDYMKSTNNFFVFPSKKGPEGPFSLV